MSDTTIINVIQPPQEIVEVKIQDTPIVRVNISTIGEKGDVGPSGGSYTHDQPAASATWNIVHNLGYMPGGIIVKDSANNYWIPGEVNYINNNQVQLKFNGSFAGTAYIS